MSGKVDAGRSEYVSNYNEREEVKLTETDVKQDSAQREELDTHDQYDLEYDDDDVSLNKCFSLCWKAKIITVEPIVFLYVFERYFAFLFSGLYYYQRFARDRLHAAGNYSITGEHFCINASCLDELLGEGTSDSVETNSTQLTLYVVLSGLVISIVSTIIIGPMTDSYGRKFALILVYVGRMFIFGDYGVFLMAITAYVTDISSVKMRLLRIGVLSLVSTISSGVTTVIGGTWINEVDCDFRSVVWGPFICCIIGILASMFAIPESLSKDQRKLNRSAANNCQRLKVIWSGFMLYFRHKLVTIKLWIILFALLMVLTISRGAILIETYFFIRRPLEWSPEEIGLYGGYNSVTHGLGLLLLMPIAHAIGVSDVVLAIIGILSTFLGYLFTAGIKKTWHMFAISSFQGVEAVVIPSIHSMMSKLVEKDEQGALFAFVSSAEMLATILGSIIFINVYNTLHQQTYFIISLMAFTASIPLCVVWIIEKCTRRCHQQVVVTESDGESDGESDSEA